ncbi:MAG: hypothetical protein KC463_06680, partial [Streptococcus sp.]|nr:hypothetical protein [Streptococcus sp.]
ENDNEYAVVYASKTFRAYEKHMGISEKEMAACVFGVKEFRPYIFGTHFTIVTDHMALKYLMSIKDPTGKLARWSMFLSQYDFEIKYRKGIDHVNADYMSRYVFLAEEDNFEKSLDPYLNKPLEEYIKFKKHKEGISKKTKNRVERAIKNFEWNGTAIMIKKDEKWLILPKTEEREKIIDKYHAMSAHFGVDSTLNRLREHYYWPKMYRDVEIFKKNCATCIRNDKYLTLNHPAFANKITNINDEISIDFSWGYDETEEGYQGIMYIQEELSKFIKTYPLKSKSKEEISDKLIDWFCTFGPCKRIRSDNEASLISEAMTKLKSAMGVEWHKTVASFSPAHNGLVERLVQTFGNAIRKLAETNRNKWAQWLPFIDFAYNTRVHSTSKITPYECMFGIRCNNFDDWTQSQNESLETALTNRTNQIKQMEETRSKTRDKIEEAQEKQKEKQNARTKRIMKTFLEKDTVVYRKNDGIINKLEPRWLGPFKVFDHDERGNYSLVDALGNGIPKKYPIEKLKIVPKSVMNEKVEEIEKIINDRRVNDSMEYQVLWKSGDQSWVKEDDFQTIECINDYWRTRTTGIEKRGPGRPRKIMNPAKTMLTALVLLSLVFCTAAEYTPKFCMRAERPSILDINNMCKMNIDRTNSDIPTGKIAILNKLHHEVSGIGFRCKAERITLKCEMGFFGGKNGCARSEWQKIEVKKDECWIMAKQKRCVLEGKSYTFDKRMKCDHNGCSVTEIPDEKYTWLETNTLHGYRCSMHKTSIMAETKETEIFAHEGCKPREYYCEDDGETIVWDESAIHACPFELVPLGRNLTKVGNKYVMLINESALFEITSKTTQCGIEMYTTSEGLYIAEAEEVEKITKLGVKWTNQTEAINNLILSNMDFNSYRTYTTWRNVEQQICQMYETFLITTLTQKESYIRIKNRKSAEAVLFSSGGIIYVPECYETSEIKYHKGPVETCHREIPVEFEFLGEKLTGFMNHQKIINLQAKTISCDIDSDIIITNTSWIRRRQKEVVIKNLSTINLVDTSPIELRFSEINFHHPNAIITGFDELKQIYQIQRERETYGEAFIEPENDIVGTELNIHKKIENLERKIEQPIKDFLNKITLLVFGLSMLLIFIV